MELAKAVSTWSKDPSTQCGAIIIGADGQVISQGYNGFPRNMLDNDDLYEDRSTKYKRIVHGEMNAIYNAALNGVSVKDATLYVYGLPCCHECAKAIIQCGIKEVIMNNSNNTRWNESCNDAQSFFKESNIKTIYL
jgi:dCMP deaminase